MKNILGLMLLFTALSSIAQNSSEEIEVKKVVTDFFEAFHEQDSVALRELTHYSVTMQSIATNAVGKTEFSTSSFGKFLKSIVSIPTTTKFEEKLLGFEIQVNGPLAHVITPYTFHVNGKLSHCGVNSFTLVKEKMEWKIAYLIDTRNKEGCESYQ